MSNHAYAAGTAHLPDAGIGGLVRAVNAEQGVCSFSGAKVGFLLKRFNINKKGKGFIQAK